MPVGGSSVWLLPCPLPCVWGGCALSSVMQVARGRGGS